jgi:hypothetical protein
MAPFRVPYRANRMNGMHIRADRVKNAQVASRRSSGPLSTGVKTPARLGSAALPEELAARWRTLSLSSVWRRPGDWDHPAVDHMAYAVAIGDDPRDSAWNLGEARGHIGAGIEESIDDVSCLYRVLGPHPTPPTVVRALAGGWADAQAGAVVTGTSRDPESGLPTSQYLSIRLAEACTEPEPGQLVVVDVAAGSVLPATRMARSAAVGEALTCTYGTGHPMAALGGGVFAVLVRPGVDVVDLTPLLRREIDRRVGAEPLRSATRCPVRIRVVDVPPTPDAAADLVMRLARS